MLPSLSLWIHWLLLTVYLLVSFALIRGRAQNTSLFLLPKPCPQTHLVAPNAAPLALFFSPFFFTLCAFPLLPHLFAPHTSNSPFAFSPLPLLFRISPPTRAPLPPPAFTNFRLPLLFSSRPVSLSLSPHEYYSSLHPSSLAPLSSSSPFSAASRRWIPLTGLVRSLDFCLTSGDI